MSNIVDEFMNSIGGNVAQNISSVLGIDKNTVSKMIPQVAPLILGGLKKQMTDQGGAPRVDHILKKYGDPGVLGNLNNLFTDKAKDNNPDPNLGGLLGGSGQQAAETLANKFNLNSSTVMKMIPMLAPVILGFLSQKRDQGGLGSSGIAALLDRDGDGNILDDVGNFLLKGQGGQGGNLLGGLLGGLLKGKK